MKLQFSKDRTVNEISSKFVRCFPFLKLRFFVTPKPGQPAFPEKELPGFALMKNICELNEPVVVEFAPTVSVDSFEKQVYEKTGLSAKIFRRQNNTWVEIKHAEDSIEEFNERGMVSQSNGYNYYTLFL